MIEGLEIRYTEMSDADHLKGWLREPGVPKWFPMKEPLEVEDSVRNWMGFARYRASLTAEFEGVPCGIATLNLMPYKKVAHQCILSIVVTQDMRNKGVGSALLNNLMHLAKSFFGLEVLYLEVYEGNPAISLYRRFGFKECGYQKHFLKDEGEYLGKIVMERVL